VKERRAGPTEGNDTVLGFKSKSENAAKKAARASALYVVVHTVRGLEPETWVGPPHRRGEAVRVFNGVLGVVPEVFAPTSANHLRVVSVGDLAAVKR
jgi:hypothetical protein